MPPDGGTLLRKKLVNFSIAYDGEIYFWDSVPVTSAGATAVALRAGLTG